MARKAIIGFLSLVAIAIPCVSFMWIIDSPSGEEPVDEAVGVADRQISGEAGEKSDASPNPTTEAESGSRSMTVPPNPLSQTTQNENVRINDGRASSGFTVEIDPLKGESLSANQTATNLRREGTEIISMKGIVSNKGVDAVFMPSDGSASMNLLQNQVLERLEHYAGIKAREGVQVTWSLTGLVTEYEGSNYLLLSSAVLIESEP